MAAYYSQDEANNENHQKIVNWYKAQIPQPKIVAVPMFINEDTIVGKLPLAATLSSLPPRIELDV